MHPYKRPTIQFLCECYLDEQHGNWKLSFMSNTDMNVENCANLLHYKETIFAVEHCLRLDNCVSIS